MRYLSVCSGIEAASVAWEPLGWQAAGFSEIEAFPSAVLQHRFPGVRNLGDFTQIIRSQEMRAHVGNVSLVVGGTPCQSFSIAGLRRGLSDERGNLALEFMRLVGELRPRWLLWENVPGVLSSGGGRDFGAILGALAQLGYGFAWRVLDAQHFGVPQRRRRVFLVGHSSGSAERAAQVLFERESVRGNPATGGQARKDAASGARGGATGHGRRVGTLTARYGPKCAGEVEAGLFIPSPWPAKVAPTLTADYGSKMGMNNQHAFSGAGLFVPAISPTVTSKWAKGSGGPAGDETHNLITQTIAFDTTQVTSPQNRSNPQPGAPCHTLPAKGQAPALAFHHTQDPVSGAVSPCLSSNADGMGALTSAGVRRLTPIECERLQGFPDGWTDVPHRGRPAADGPRYKALGNSMAVPVMRWIGERITRVDAEDQRE